LLFQLSRLLLRHHLLLLEVLSVLHQALLLLFDLLLLPLLRDSLAGLGALLVLLRRLRRLCRDVPASFCLLFLF
jgi:hypothetical protein